jgi:hypothetical protein
VCEGNDIIVTAQSIVFTWNINSVFHFHEAFTSLWMSKGTATGKVFFFPPRKSKTLVSLKLNWEYLTGVALGSGRRMCGFLIV